MGPDLQTQPRGRDEKIVPGRLLIIDDEPLIRQALASYLTGCGYTAITAANGAEGLARARAGQFCAVLVDLRMPHVDGLEVIATLKDERPELPVVVVSGTGVLNDAVEAMRRGAWGYITKPIQDINEIAVVVEKVLTRARLVAERDHYQREIERLNRSLAAEVARQTQDLRTQNRELAALNRVSWAISDPLDLDTMLNRAIDAAVAALEADSCIVRLFDPATDQLVIAAAQGVPESCLSSLPPFPLDQGVFGRVAQSGRPCIGKDCAGDSWLTPLQKEMGEFSCLCVPLRAGDEAALLPEPAASPEMGKRQIVGTLEVIARADRDYDAREIELLAMIGNQIGVAVARSQYAAHLKEANAELGFLDALREQFIQNVAHELRTPLAVAFGYTEMLANNGLNPEEQRMALDASLRSLQELVNLVDSITTLQDLSTRSLHVEEVAPAELLQVATQMCRQRAQSAGVKLRTIYPSLPSLPGDLTRLAQALNQLIDNACKFSPAGSTVTVAAQLSPLKDAVEISVADQGIGIPAEEYPRIFQRFYQVDGSTTRRYGGTGLGLALVKEIVDAHKGQVDVESKVGMGSIFTVQLPLERAAKQQK